MAVTILAVLFLLVIALVAFAGYRIVIRKESRQEAPDMERCAICRSSFDKSRLLMREIGDYKLLFFCSECVIKLYADLGIKN